MGAALTQLGKKFIQIALVPAHAHPAASATSRCSLLKTQRSSSLITGRTAPPGFHPSAPAYITKKL